MRATRSQQTVDGAYEEAQKLDELWPAGRHEWEEGASMYAKEPARKKENLHVVH